MHYNNVLSFCSAIIWWVIHHLLPSIFQWICFRDSHGDFLVIYLQTSNERVVVHTEFLFCFLSQFLDLDFTHFVRTGLQYTSICYNSPHYAGKWRNHTEEQCTIFINARLAILKNLKCLKLKKELNTKKDYVKMSHYVLSFMVIFSSDKKLQPLEFWLKHESEANDALLLFPIQMS